MNFRPLAAKHVLAMLLFIAVAPAAPAWAQNADDDWDRFARAGVQAYGLNQIPEALENLEAAMRVADENFTEDDRRTLNSILNLAPLYATLDRYDEAVPMAERAVAIQEAEGGPDNPELTITLPMLAGFYRDTGRLDDSVATLERGAELMDLVMGEINPRALTIREELAIALFRAGRLEDSLAMFQRILPLWEEALGPNHIRIAMSYGAYAGLLRDMGMEAEAVAADEIIVRIEQAWDRR